jgi:hypothetical protein
LGLKRTVEAVEVPLEEIDLSFLEPALPPFHRIFNAGSVFDHVRAASLWGASMVTVVPPFGPEAQAVGGRVDNAADTEGLANLRRRYPASDTLTWCHEPIQGLSRARNLAIRMARGELLAFMDDDALIGPRSCD